MALVLPKLGLLGHLAFWDTSPSGILSHLRHLVVWKTCLYLIHLPLWHILSSRTPVLLGHLYFWDLSFLDTCLSMILFLLRHLPFRYFLFQYTTPVYLPSGTIILLGYFPYHGHFICILLLLLHVSLLSAH